MLEKDAPRFRAKDIKYLSIRWGYLDVGTTRRCYYALLSSLQNPMLRPAAVGTKDRRFSPSKQVTEGCVRKRICERPIPSQRTNRTLQGMWMIPLAFMQNANLRERARAIVPPRYGITPLPVIPKLYFCTMAPLASSPFFLPLIASVSDLGLWYSTDGNPSHQEAATKSVCVLFVRLFWIIFSVSKKQTTKSYTMPQITVFITNAGRCVWIFPDPLLAVVYNWCDDLS